MKSYWKMTGLVLLGAAIAYYPALKLYQYMTAKGKDVAENLEGEGEMMIKHLFNHKAHKPHHRKAGADGHLS